MNSQKFQTFFFMIILVVSLALTLLVFRPYLVLLLVGAVLSVLFRPLYTRLLKPLKSPAAAAFLTVITMALSILLPVSFFAAALYKELMGAVWSARGHLDPNSLAHLLQQYLPASVTDLVPSLASAAAEQAQAIGSRLLAGMFGVFSDVIGAIFSAAIVLVVSYYLIKDGQKIKQKMLALSPLDDRHDELVIDKVVVAVRAVMGGVLVVAVVKALIAGVALAFAGMPAPVFWGAMTGLASMMPIIGTTAVAVLTVGYLILSGHLVSGIIIAAVFLIVIHPVDNLIQPKFVESQTDIHPLLILLSILGGLSFYGFMGFVLGPLTLAVTVALVDIYNRDIRKHIQGEPEQE